MSDKCCVLCGRSPAKFREMVVEYETNKDWKLLRDWLSKCKSCTDTLCQRYTKATGRCIVCNQLLSHHGKCRACGILVGPGHITTNTTVIAGHRLCGSCLRAWKKIPLGIIYTMALEHYLDNSGCKLEWLKYEKVDEEYFKRG